MPVGTVKWFNRKRGFGFIQPDGGDKDAFVHISAVKRAGLLSLDEGQRIEYELKPLDDGRMMADGLTVAGDSASEDETPSSTEDQEDPSTPLEALPLAETGD